MEKILIVDDDLNICELLRLYIEKYSLSVSRMVLLPGWMYLKEYLNY